jgi:hypothetical protein
MPRYIAVAYLSVFDIRPPMQVSVPLMQSRRRKKLVYLWCNLGAETFLVSTQSLYSQNILTKYYINKYLLLDKGGTKINIILCYK